MNSYTPDTDFVLRMICMLTVVVSQAVPFCSNHNFFTVAMTITKSTILKVVQLYGDYKLYCFCYLEYGQLYKRAEAATSSNSTGSRAPGGFLPVQLSSITSAHTTPTLSSPAVSWTACWPFSETPWVLSRRNRYRG